MAGMDASMITSLGTCRIGDALVRIDHGESGAVLQFLFQLRLDGVSLFFGKVLDDAVKIGQSMVGVKTCRLEEFPRAFQERVQGRSQRSDQK